MLTVRTEVTDRILIFGDDTYAESSPSTRSTRTVSGRIEHYSCVRHARKHLSPSRSTTGSDGDRSLAA